MKRQDRRIDLSAIIAVSWALIAIIMTVILYDKLGARGWLWLWVHHIFCIIGVSYEWREHQKRVQALEKCALSQGSNPSPHGANPINTGSVDR
jgi:hypothetical protein